MKDIDPDGADIDGLLSEGDIAEKSVELLETLAEKAHTAVEAMTPERLGAVADAVAKKTIKLNQSDYDAGVLRDNLKALYGSVAGVTDWRSTVQIAADLGKSVVAQSYEIDPYMKEQYKDLRAKLRQTKIRLTSKQQDEIKSAFDSVEKWRRRNFGRFTISNKGVPLDSLFMELAEQYPELFDADANEAEMPFILTAALDAVQPRKYRLFYEGMNLDSAGLDTGMQMLYDFFDTAIRNQGNNAPAEKARYALKTRMAQIRQQYKTKYAESLKRVKQDNAKKRQALARRYNQMMGEIRAKADWDVAEAKLGTEMAVRRQEAAKLRKQYERLTDRRNDALDRQRARYDQRRKAERERRIESGAAFKQRARIEKAASEMRAWLERPTDKKHVPEFFRKQLAAVLGGLDMNAKGGRETFKGARWAESVKALSDFIGEMERARTGADQNLVAKYRDLQVMLDPDLVSNLEEMARDLARRGAMRPADMRSGELRVLADMMDNLKHGINAMNKLHTNARYQTAQALGDATASELQALKTKKSHTGAMALADDFANVAQLDPFRFFKRLGKAARTVLDALDRGQRAAQGRVRESQDYMAAVKGDLNVNRKTMQAWGKHRVNVKLESGRTLTMSTLNIMELYNLWRRPQAQEHILRGGIKLADLEGTAGKKISQERAMVTEADVRTIIGKLSDTQRQFAEAMQRYVSEEAAKWGNETSMQLYGYEKFGEETYWPINTDRNFLRRGEDRPGLFNAFTNAGFTKALTPGAKNPIVIGDAMQTFADHVAKMANYNGLAAPMEDALRWYNYVRRDVDERGIPVGYDTSIKEQMERVVGREGKKYIEMLFEDINGQSGGKMGVDPGSKLLSLYKKSAIAGNLRVVIQQPTSIFRAGLHLSPARLTQGLRAVTSMKRTIAEMQQHSSIAWWKGQGHFEIGMGKSMRDIILGDASTLDAVSRVAMAPASKADDMTWAVIWEACKAEVKAKNKGLSGEAFFKAVDDLFTTVVNETQVVDSVLHRSQFMKNKSGLAQIASSFMAEPTKQYNMFHDAIRAVYRGEAGAGKLLARSALSVTASITANRLVKAIYDALTKRDEDDDVLNEIADNFAGSAVDWINEYLSIPYVQDVMDILQGWDVERPDMALLKDAFDTVNEAMKMLRGESKKNPLLVTNAMLKSVGALTGVPLNGVLTSLERVANAIWPGAVMWTSEGATDSYAALLRYIKDGNADKARDLRGRIQTALSEAGGVQYNKMGYTPKADKEIDAGVAKLLALGDEARGVEPDARIAMGWAAREAADTKEVDALKEMFVDEGFTGEMFDRALEYYGQAQAEKEPEAKNLAEQLDQALFAKRHLWTAFDRAVSGGGDADLKRVAREIMDDSKAKDPASAVKEAVGERAKQAYLEAYQAGDTRAMARIAGVLEANGWYAQENLNTWVAQEVKAGLWAAFDAGDVAAARKAANELIEGGLVAERNNLLTSINDKYGPIYKDLYFSGRIAEAEALARKLQALELKNNKGESAYSESWIARYWRSSSNRKKWEEMNRKAG